MKKKTLLLVGLCAIGLCTWEAQAINQQTIPVSINNGLNNMPNEFDKINLMGDLMFAVGPNAIEAGASDDAIYIGFNQSFGNVNISIYNSMGIAVLWQVVSTSWNSIMPMVMPKAISITYN